MLLTQIDSRIISTEGIITKNQFEKDVHIFCELFHMKGISSQDHVVLKSDNSYWFIVSLFSLCQMAVSIIVIDSQTLPDEIMEIYTETEANVILTDICPELKNVNAILIPALLEEYKLYFKMAIESPICKIDFSKWCERKDALILYSSGTTGKPKGIVKSGSTFIENIVDTIQMMKYVSSDCMLPIVPFSHFYGLSLIFSWWFVSCSFIICNPKNLWSIITQISKDQATIVDANPSAYYTLLRLLERKPRQLELIKNAKIRMWCVGGSPLTSDLDQKFNSIFGQPLLNGYGLSELGNVTLGTLDNPKGCGKPLPGVMLKILDQNKNEVDQGITGEVWIKSIGRMEGYLNRPELTESVIEKDWFQTGDLGYFNQNNLYVIGRIGKTINRMGYMISAVYIEDRISSFGYRCCVVTLDDISKGNLIIIFIESEYSEILHSLRKEMNTVLPTYMYPDRLFALKTFPLNRNGKVDRLHLEKLAQEKIELRKN